MRSIVMCVLVLLLSARLLADTCPEVLDHSFKRLHSTETINVSDLCGKKATLVVNTASYCGYTKQFTGLEALHQKYHSQGLRVIGFASNSFNQEADDEAEVADVCFKNFGVTFDMMAISPVTGKDANPVFKHLAQVAQEPNWNFNKYLMAPNGSIQHFDSRTTPLNSGLEAEVVKLLTQAQNQ